MKRLNPKIAAFTIAEILVVLILSSILILLAMGVLNLVQKQIQLVEKNYNNNDKVRTLERLLWQDFNQYELYYDMNNESLMGISPIDSVRYSFAKSYILRNTDTIKVEIQQKTLFLNAEKTNSGRVDALELELSKSHQNTILFCYQTKDATYYINNNR